jgi:hypothetical protein
MVRAQEADVVRLKREAKTKGGFYCEPEAKVVFVMRIKGLNKVAPKVMLETRPDVCTPAHGPRPTELGRRALHGKHPKALQPPRMKPSAPMPAAGA